MKKKIFALFIMLLLAIGVIYGCNQTKDTESTREEEERVTYISFENAKKEDFINELKNKNIGEDTLLIGVDTDYSEKAIEQLNQLLEKEGYEFNVLLCRLPDQCILDGSFAGFVQYLKEEKVYMDILPIWNTDIKAATETGLFLDLSGKIEKEKSIKDAYPEKFWELTSVNGKHYGVGTFILSTNGWEVNKELMEKYGFTQEDLSKEITELEEVFKKVREGESDPKFVVFGYEPRFLLENIPFTYVDSSLPIGYWHEEGGSSVGSLFDTDKMKELVAKMHDYHEKGYARIAANMSEQTYFFMHTDYVGYPIRRSDSLDTWTNYAGMELVRVPSYQQTTNDFWFAINAISSWSEKQEEAWEFLKFIYTNKEASILLRYGIEGEDYSMSGDVAVAGENLSENIIYNRSLGNLQLAVPLSPYEDASKNVLVEEGLDNLQDSFLAGFVFDTKPVQKEVDAVRELYMELPTFRTMFAYESWEGFYEAYRQELKDAGIDCIVDEMNRQIQEHLKK